MVDKNKQLDEEQIKEWIERGVKKLEDVDCGEKKGWKKHSGSGAAGTIWFLGFVGAAVFFIQQAASFGAGVVGLLKALVWPAFIVHALLEFLNI